MTAVLWGVVALIGLLVFFYGTVFRPWVALVMLLACMGIVVYGAEQEKRRIEAQRQQYMQDCQAKGEKETDCWTQWQMRLERANRRA